MTSSTEEQAHPVLGDDREAQRLQEVQQPTVRVVRPEDFDADTAQTSGMQRFAAISSTLVGSQGIWAGYTMIEKHVTTGWHHCQKYHNLAETGLYAKGGRTGR